MFELQQDLDPDQNLLNNINTNCCYYTDQQYNININYEHGISIIHINSRSLFANFQNIKEYLGQFKKPFSIIAISETWINTNRGSDFSLHGYGFHHISRERGNGGGVALFVDEGLTYKVLECMSMVIDDVMECITIEISMERIKNMIVSCVYRKPGSSIDIFMSNMERLFTTTTQKVNYVCGDFNIDLLNPKGHKLTNDFLELMYSMSLYPTITKPSRITTHSASLIDNIFTNNMDNNMISGLIISDISDHLPVFIIYKCNYNKRKELKETKYKRIRTEESISVFREELLKLNWNSICEETNVDKAYELFLETFKDLYDKNCPIKQYSIKSKYVENQWMTKGLQNACKKKNNLYKIFIKYKTKEAELKYKKYKNKLTNIMRICKKDYYTKLLDKNKNNVKGIWNILNNIIRNKPSSLSYPDHFTDKDRKITIMKDVVDE